MPTDCQRTVDHARGAGEEHVPPVVAEGGPFSKVAQRHALSRLRRCMSRNCTLVTSRRPGNRQVWPSARPAADMPMPNCIKRREIPDPTRELGRGAFGPQLCPTKVVGEGRGYISESLPSSDSSETAGD